MHKLSLIVLLLSVFYLNSCDNDLNLVEEGEDIPVVYALFDVGDTAHYVRIEKAFVDPLTPPVNLAMDPQNLYFDNLSASFFKNSNPSGAKIFAKVDGNQEGYVRDSGAFAQAPNFLYKLKNTGLDLNFRDSFALQIDLGEGKIISGSTKLVEPAVLIKPNSGGNLDFDDKINTRYSWNPGDNGIIHSMALIIHYDENKGGSLSSKTLNWNLFSNINTDRYEFAGKAFYQFLASNLEVSNTTTRIIKGIDVIFTSGGQSVADYIRVGQANLGITSSGEVPVYTNLSFGRGIVGSRAKTVIKNLQLSRNSIDRLKTGEFTKDLNFQ